MNECLNCFNNCPDGNPIKDRCIQYSGPDIPCLGICTGDSLYQFEAAVAEKLCTALDGTGIDLSLDISCEFLTNILDGKDQTLSNVLQMLITASCTLKELVDALDAIVNAPLSIVGDCLSLPANPTRDQVLQALATKTCSIDTRVSTIEGDYVKSSELCDKVNDCLAGGSVQFYSRMVPYVAYPYHGSLSNFDASGNGLSANGFDKVYLCVGQTIGAFALPDYRGRSPLGANTGVPGGALDSAVDPSLPQNAGYSIVNKTKKGAYTDTLANSQIPSHSHSVIDPGHTHNISTQTWPQSGSTTQCYSPRAGGSPTTIVSAPGTTGILIGSTGGGQPHNSTHPSIGCNMIMYIP